MTSSRRARLSGFFVLCCGLLLLSCEDPSGVGLTVIDFGETDPSARIVPAEVSIDTLADFTGFVLSPGVPFTNRFIAGRAEDPLFGTIEATGYVDFFRPANITPGFFDATFEETFLRLNTDYVYGDTSTVATFDVFEIEERWDARRFRSDTTLQVIDRLIGSFDVVAADTVVQVPLSPQWLADRDTLLRATNFNDRFHGFEIRPRKQNQMAVGFVGTSEWSVVISFEGAAEADTVNFLPNQIATATQRQLPAMQPVPELLPLQDNTGESLYLTLRLDTLSAQALSAGFIRIDADTLLMQQFKPQSFVRPMARILVLYGMGAGGPTALAEAGFDRATESFTFASTPLNITLQEMVRNRSRFDSLVVGLPRAPITLNAVPLIARPEAPPRAVLLVVPTDL